MTGGLDRQHKPLGDVWILDIERGNWRKVRLNFTLCVVYIHIIIVCMLYSLVLNPRRTCAARVTVVCPVSECVFPRPSPATDATKRQSKHTGGLSIMFASD